MLLHSRNDTSKYWGSINIELSFLGNTHLKNNNFQTMVMNSFVIHSWNPPPPLPPLLKSGGRTFQKLSHFGHVPHDLMRGQIGSYAYMQIWSYMEFHDGQKWKSVRRNKYIQSSKIKTNQQQVERKNCFTLKMHIFCSNLIRAKEGW